MTLSTSVLIPSFRRPDFLSRCLERLQKQSIPPGEVLVVWQADDFPTRDALASQARPGLVVLHSPKKGIVEAENLALSRARGEILLLIDDDALPELDWIERHLRHYQDPRVGAVGGPAYNFTPDGRPFPKRAVEPVGALSWFGRVQGNMHDPVDEWRRRAPIEVDHLVGYNLSLRRKAIGVFEGRLRPYWQCFELDACLQVKARGYRVLFDFANIVSHYPTNTAYVEGREGDLDIKIYNPAFNKSLILSKHTSGPLRLARLAYLLAAGSVNAPGLAAALVAVKRYGKPFRELRILLNTWRAVIEGWRLGGARGIC